MLGVFATLYVFWCLEWKTIDIIGDFFRRANLPHTLLRICIPRNVVTESNNKNGQEKCFVGGYGW